MSIGDFILLSSVMIALGMVIGFVVGALNRQRYYKRWFKFHCYFCGVFLHASEETTSVDFAGTFEASAHVSCWELNHFAKDWSEESE